VKFDTPPALGPLYARALLDRRPPSMPEGRETPRLEGRLAPHAIDADRLVRYRAVCGFDSSGTVPITFPHVLAAGLQMRMLTEPAFPVRLAGLIHVSHVIRQPRPIPSDALPGIHCWLEGSRATEAGEAFCLNATAELDGEVCWEEETHFIARAARRGRGTPSRPVVVAEEAAARWEAGADIGRRYARVSGDYNPIHLWPWSARLFGFPGAIAHGMWSLARCAAALEPRTAGPCVLEVRFLRPLVLPATVELRRAEETSAATFQLIGPGDGTVYLAGSVSGL
jgi:hypothetical protein